MKEQDLVIDNFQKGIAASPHVGFGDMRNLDISTIPGSIRINNLTELKANGATLSINQVISIVRNPINSSQFWAVSIGGSVLQSNDSGATWTVIAGNTAGNVMGLEIWKDYLFVARASALDVLGPLTGTIFTVTIANPAVFTKVAHGLAAGNPIIFSTTGALPTGLTAGTTYYVIAAGLTADAFEVSTSAGGVAVITTGSQSGVHTFIKWTNSWETIDSDANWHPMLVSKNDGNLYGGASRYIYSLSEVSTFVPANGATFTFTQQALDLPANYRIRCLEELGNNLMIGTWMGINVSDFRIADIFPWDRTSDSFTLPLTLDEHGVNSMININNILYILAGIGGKLFSSNGVQSNLIAQLPSSVVNVEGTEYLDPFMTIMANYKGKIFFGIAGTTNTSGIGVWSFVLDSKGGILNFEHVISNGRSGGASSLVQITAILPVNRNTLLIAWKCDNGSTTYGIDKINNLYRYTAYAAYFESPFYQVGTPLNKKQYSQIEFQLTEALTTGQGIVLKYRTDLSATWTTIGTYDFATLGAVMSHNVAPGIPDCEFIQIRGELTTAASSNTSPKLRTVILR